MKLRALAFALVVLAAALPAAEAGKGRRKTEAGAGWNEGAAGYRAALAAQETSGKPVLLYFHAPWCQYCRHVDKKLLIDPAVAAKVETMIRVRIYGEDGPDEQKLMERFGAEAYPRMFVKPDFESEFRPVPLFEDGTKLVAPEALAAALP